MESEPFLKFFADVFNRCTFQVCLLYCESYYSFLKKITVTADIPDKYKVYLKKMYCKA